MKDLLLAYVKRVTDLVDHVKGNEQATKQSLIGPLFTLLGYDLTDPRECIPEFKADFGKERSSKPVDWAFLQGGHPVFFVEAKEVGKKLTGYDEQLGDYFAKAPGAKLGILTNGVEWRFYTDSVAENIMDQEPFLTWSVREDEQPPFDFLTLLQRSQFNSELIRTFAQRKHHHRKLMEELDRLFEPSYEFTRLAVEKLETRNFTDKVYQNWKPILTNVINEWARQRRLDAVLSSPASIDQPATAEDRVASKTETTQDELDAYRIVQQLLGPGKPVEFEDTQSYFKVHLPNQRFWAVCRLYLGRRRSALWVPLAIEKVQPLIPSMAVTSPHTGWTSVPLTTTSDIGALGEVLRQSWDSQWALRGKSPDSPPADVSE